MVMEKPFLENIYAGSRVCAIRLFICFQFDVPVLVGTAFRTGGMRKLGFLALGTGGHGRGLGFVMGPSFSAPGFGAFLLGYCHGYLLI
jgi:hypothetical protein